MEHMLEKTAHIKEARKGKRERGRPNIFLKSMIPNDLTSPTRYHFLKFLPPPNGSDRD
jgi:hypothetical protein